MVERPKPPTPTPPTVKRILHAAKEQDAGARAAAADVGRLHLLHLDGAVRCLALDRVRSERDVPDTPGKIQHTCTHEREARHDPLHRLFGHRTSPCVPCVGIRSASTPWSCVPTELAFSGFSWQSAAPPRPPGLEEGQQVGVELILVRVGQAVGRTG